jgi:ubiquinone/menaquinone biosynthesis C-methylase UbiE
LAIKSNYVRVIHNALQTEWFNPSSFILALVDEHHMTELERIIDLHLRNTRQGPGSDATTRRALADTGLAHSRALSVADIGCGTGAASLILAQLPDAHVTAIDAAEPFVARLHERAIAAGVADRIDACVGNMNSLPFSESQFDLIWSEGAIYNMGFEAGLNAWRRYLKPNGVIAVSELTWKTQSRPADIQAHWTSEYPGINTLSSNVSVLEQAG